jgi:hypothetical protein
MNNKSIKIISYLLISVILILIAYTFLHEMGHALIGILCGGSISDFTIGFNAHVSITGAKYNNITLPLGNAFGAVLPYVICFIIVLLYNNRIKNDFYKIFILFFTICTTSSIFAWVFVPFLYSQGKAPINDDVTKFLDNSHFSPWIVSLIACILILWMLFISLRIKKVQKGYLDMVKELKNKQKDENDL